MNGCDLPPVLDVSCGSRMMWFDRANPVAVFGDCRRETLTVTDRSHGKQDGTRTVKVEPDNVLRRDRSRQRRQTQGDPGQKAQHVVQDGPQKKGQPQYVPDGDVPAT